MPAIYLFTRDLRLEDHAGLAAAAGYGEVLPVLVIDKALEARVGASTRRAAFFCGAVAALDAALHERGSRLIVRRGNAGPAIKQLAKAHGAETVAWSASYDRAGVRALAVHDAPALAPEETTAARPSSGDGYRAFVPYYDLWRQLEPASYEAPLLLRFTGPDVKSEALPEP